MNAIPRWVPRGCLAAASFIAVLALGSPAAAGQVNLQVGEGAATCGGQLRVPVEVTDLSGLGALDVAFEFDEGLLEFRRADPAAAVEDATFVCKPLRAGAVRCGLISTAALEAEGVLFTLVFAARDRPGAAVVTPVDAQAWAAREAFALRVATQPGTWTLESASALSDRRALWTAGVVGGVLLLVIVFRMGRRTSG